MTETPILKTAAEIAKMRAANRVVAQALRRAGEIVKPGVTTGEINAVIEEVIIECGAAPLFTNYPSASVGVAPFPTAACISVDEEVVHGIPSFSRILREGQIVSVDVGARLDGFCGDAAKTFPVGEVSKKARKLLEVCAECLQRAIAAINPQRSSLGDIANAVQKHAERNGFSVVRQYVGHGIGRAMHEAPQIPNFYHKKYEMDLRLLPGMVLAIEPMINGGASNVKTQADGWTVVTRDHSLSAHFEHSVALTEHGAEILSLED
jgi:methionyl aminopeptidase